MTDAPVPPQAPPYDYIPLLERCERAGLILRNPGRKADRFKTAARVLCDFYRVLDEDNAFWDEVERLTGDQPDVRGLFEALGNFEDQEYDLLIRAGVDEYTAAGLAGDLKIKLERYQPGDLPVVRNIRNDVQRIGRAVCDAENDLDNAQRRRSRLKLLSRALSVAQAIVTAAVNIPVPPLALLSVAGGLMMVVQTAADYFGDRENDG